MDTVGRSNARTQYLFREVNERIAQVGDFEPFHVICECDDADCMATLRVSRDEYEAVRRMPSHFLARPGHFDPRVERIVTTQDGWIVVEQFGDAGLEAVAADPRAAAA